MKNKNEKSCLIARALILKLRVSAENKRSSQTVMKHYTRLNKVLKLNKGLKGYDKTKKLCSINIESSTSLLRC